MRTLTYSGEPSLNGGGSTPLRSLTGRRDLHLMAHLVRNQWRDVCSGAGVAHTVTNATGGCVTTPEVTHVHLAASEAVLTVRMLPGQLPADLTNAAERLAFGMGAHGVRVEPFLADYVKVKLLATDPLADTITAVRPVVSALDPILLGVDETGVPVTLDLATAAHVIIQGSTGSGKSIALYSLLCQLAGTPDVIVTGVDPTGLLLAPWVNGTALSPALGTLNPFSYLATLDKVVAEMDRRISRMAAGCDSVDLHNVPVLLVVLEEHPGALRVLDGHDTKIAKTYRCLVSRLLSEGRKAGVRLILLTQRADASIIGAFERGQASHRISYRVDSIDGLRMLHPDLTPELAAQHSSALPGVALATMPGRPLMRLRSPYLPYSSYCAEVAGRSGRCHRTGLRPITAPVGAPGSRVKSRSDAVGALDAGGAGAVGRPATGRDHAGSAPGSVA